MNIQLSMRERELMTKALRVHGEYELLGHVYHTLGQLVTVLDEYEREVVERDAITEVIAEMHIALSRLTVLVGENNVHYHIERKLDDLAQALRAFKPVVNE